MVVFSCLLGPNNDFLFWSALVFSRLITFFGGDLTGDRFSHFLHTHFCLFVLGPPNFVLSWKKKGKIENKLIIYFTFTGSAPWPYYRPILFTFFGLNQHRISSWNLFDKFALNNSNGCFSILVILIFWEQKPCAKKSVFLNFLPYRRYIHHNRRLFDKGGILHISEPFCIFRFSSSKISASFSLVLQTFYCPTIEKNCWKVWKWCVEL